MHTRHYMYQVPFSRGPEMLEVLRNIKVPDRTPKQAHNMHGKCENVYVHDGMQKIANLFKV